MADKMTRRVLLGTVAVGSAAAASAAAFGFGRGGGPASATPPPVSKLAEVTREDLVDVRVVKGRLGFGEQTTIIGYLPGVVTSLHPVGSVIDRGDPLCRVDDRPLIVLYGALPMWRDLMPGMKGKDVWQLQDNLRVLGDYRHTTDGAFSSATVAAVKRWQRRVGLDDSGRVERGRVIFTDGAIRIAAHRAQRGSASTGPLVDATGTSRAVTLKLSAADRDLAREGAPVTVTLSGGKRIDAKVGSVLAVVASGPTAADELSVTITIADQVAVATVGDAQVDVDFAVGKRLGVLTVPVTALLALREGGYGVQVSDGSAVKTVAVQVGLFTLGKVEVSGPGLTEGMRVIVP